MLLIVVAFVLIAAAPSAAIAQVLCICPPIQRSTVDPILIGSTSGYAQGSSAPFRVRILSINLSPVPGMIVRLDFSATSMRLYDRQNPGTTVNCAARTLSRISGADGRAVFTPRVAGSTASNSIAVYAGSDLLAYVQGRSTDFDGLDARTALTDFSSFATAFAEVQPHPAASGTYCP